ncbi:hypothetical protein D1614_20010 [Maribellus luteus]|uniref:Secreted protein n=1 Tax=Maribellus luteus TaxID=2305463 RepID=A0A399SSH3_9BACT|nr:hypothetical protein [Maribellus luteus]RIJ46258.1 hypothetical protein D1614_20010 [Maribellus luteus]
MKKLLLVLWAVIPFFVYSQNQVTTKSGIVFIAKIDGLYGTKLVFSEIVPELKNDEIDISDVVSIAGEIPTFRSKSIKRKNSDVKFLSGDFSKEYKENLKEKRVSDDLYFDPNAKNQELNENVTAGDYLQSAGIRYLTGVGLGFGGAGISLIGASSEQESLIVVGGIAALTGAIFIVTGHLQLIKAGEKMNRDAVTLSPSNNGIGLVINF